MDPAGQKLEPGAEANPFCWRVASQLQEVLDQAHVHILNPTPTTNPKLEQGESDLKISDPDAFNQAAESALQKMARTAVCSCAQRNETASGLTTCLGFLRVWGAGPVVQGLDFRFRGLLDPAAFVVSLK